MKDTKNTGRDLLAFQEFGLHVKMDVDISYEHNNTRMEDDIREIQKYYRGFLKR